MLYIGKRFLLCTSFIAFICVYERGNGERGGRKKVEQIGAVKSDAMGFGMGEDIFLGNAILQQRQ
jgi:hypothetical protein